MNSQIFHLFSIFICLFLFIYPAMSSPKLGEFFADGQGGKMAKNNHWENWEEENVDGKMDDPFSIPKAKPMEEDLSVGKEPMADGGIGELFERLGRSELIQSIIRMLGQINGREMREEEEGDGVNEEYSREKEQKIERRSAAKSHEKEQTMMRPSGRIISRINVDKKPQMDQPLFYIRSPSIVQQQNNKRPFTISESIDSRPMTISKNAEEHFIGPKEQNGGDQMASIQEAIGKEWKHSLFGRSGLLTEIFNFVNDKRKEGLLKQQQTAQIQQQAAPNLNADKSGNDFAKILDSLLNKAKTGDFDEPLPEIPFIGICNRLSCGDIYKALDEFRKSEFFSNFQTAISLLNDPKGFDMIGELLANPELLENFTGPESLGELFGTGKKVEGKKTATVEIDENTDAENIGVDFSTYIDGKELPKENRPLPQISTSIDSGSSDYYSSVDEKGEELEHKNLEKEEKLIPKRTETANQIIGKPKDKFAERPLPEIAESIDAKPMDEEDEFPEGPMTFEKNEFLPISSNNNKNQHNGTSVIVMTPKVEIRLGRDRKPQQIIGQNGRTNSSANVKNRAKNSTSEVIIVPIHRTNNNQRSGQKIINLVTKIPSSSSSTTTTQRPLPTTTRRNFRRDNDYYSMYYDDGNGESGG